LLNELAQFVTESVFFGEKAEQELSKNRLSCALTPLPPVLEYSYEIEAAQYSDALGNQPCTGVEEIEGE
jgi:hypothetical protein